MAKKTTRSDHLWSPIGQLFEMWRNQELCDVTLCVGDMEFRAHRLILSACSPYFKAMFLNNDTLESKQESVPIACPDGGGWGEETMGEILNCIYTGEITIDRSNVESLLAAADYFQIDKIIQECCQYYRNKLNLSNCCRILALGDMYSCKCISTKAELFLREHFKAVSAQKEFLSDLDINQLIKIISTGDIHIPEHDGYVNQEEVIFEAIIGWINFEKTTRIRHLPNCLKHVKFLHMNPCYLLRLTDHPLIKANRKSRRYIDRAKNSLFSGIITGLSRKGMLMHTRRKIGTEREKIDEVEYSFLNHRRTDSDHSYRW